ncbi:MAG: response regulator transcription factor [Myxococcota bacterium]|nr:response regulator transcription factor [Myxococcota bacterium]
MSAEILVVDDDPKLREVVRYTLAREGYGVHEAGDGAQAWEMLQNLTPDLIVLDVLMPEMDGLELCRRIRQDSRVPILFLSSKDEELDKVLGLELGGDDYMAKPFSPRELASRVKAVLRRTRPPSVSEAPNQEISHGALRMHTGQHRAWFGPVELPLTLTEFRLLQVLLQTPGHAFPRAELVHRAYPGNHHVSDRTLDSHVRRIRAKLREADAPALIETVHGLGYRLRQEPALG